ncbi:hypothetical protein OG417_07925 [Actinoallomurus sp. NBC_01490]|uniref:hypothetical protein n=1 Tax=Actinoallomurus sp. NBC_01490 TaxID=2903557 RepID=UPI002E32B4E6|nr:hypothetical protein [Actinoallomurus sp. NBC_01490]
MMLRGYLDGYEPPVDESVLVAASEWMDDPRWWPAFLWSVGGSHAAAGAFDVDPADVETMLETLHRTERWPVMSINAAGDSRVFLVWRNFEDDSGWDYLLTAAGSDTPTELAVLDGHFRGPGLSWAELIAMAGQPDGERGPAERLLLLLPAVGDADLLAADLVTAAVAAVGARRQQQEIASELLRACERFWGRCEWDTVHEVPVCLGPHSPRHPTRHPLPELQRIAQAFTAR